ATVPHILDNTEEVFFTRNLGILKQSLDICFKKIKEIPCLTCPQKPQGASYSKHKILIVADEIDGHLAFGDNPFVPMGVFGSMVPVLTLGSLSKRWIVPGWRLGWFVTGDPKGIFKNTKVKLNVSLLKDISDDIEFCFKLAKEESVILLPGDKHTAYNSFKMH
ncbi:Aminotransferase, class I/classII, partial [Cynara cardunculus var. scolymus]